MLNVYVISSEVRVAKLIEFFQPYFKAKIRCAADFDHGLKEVFENRPSIVFIQSTIGTVSGETVARHIKSLLGSESPCIVFIGDGEAGEKKRVSWCDEWIPLSDSDEQLQQNFSAIIAARFPEEWQEIADEMANASNAVPGDAGDFERGLAVALAGNAGHESADGATSRGERETVAAVASTSEDPASVEAVSARAGSAEDALPAFIPPEADFSDRTFPPATRRSVPLVRIGLAMLALAVLGYGAWTQLTKTSRTGSSVSTPAAMESAPAPAGLVKLPEFIDPKWHDPAYSRNNPGWERYRSSGFEFRVYRPTGTIQALQIISLRPEGITAAFLRNLLQQTGYPGPLPSGSEKNQDGMVVVSYRLAAGAELVVYLEQGGAPMRAAVLAF